MKQTTTLGCEWVKHVECWGMFGPIGESTDEAHPVAHGLVHSILCEADSRILSFDNFHFELWILYFELLTTPSHPHHHVVHDLLF